jgi:uridylate kinase
MTNERIIISLGGSLIFPDSIDTDFLDAFRKLMLTYIESGTTFVFITGGGKVCRRYQDALKSLRDVETTDLDWMGIATTRANAMLVKLLFKEYAYEEVILNPGDAKGINSPVIIGAGWKPGWSTDYDAIEMAIETGAKKVINLSNIDFVYTADPKTNPDAVKIEKTTWAEYRKIIPSEWTSGINAPFDPIASKHAEENGIEVAIMNGKNLENLKNFLDGKEFLGTVIN